MKTVLFVLLSLLVLSCATTSMTPEGNKVTIITSFSPEDAAKYDDVGVVSCEEDLISSDAPEYCRNSLRNQRFKRDQPETASMGTFSEIISARD